MKLLAAFFRLIRWPNLLFIALTQSLFYYCIILPVLPADYQLLQHKLTSPIFFLLMAASVLIAAAGYIINDYFDLNIDQINKPEKMVVQKIINRRWAILLHLVITAAGLAISFYVSIKTSVIIFIANVFCAFLLWVYSTTFKKKLLWGNVIISVLTAWTVLVLYFACNNHYIITSNLSYPVFWAMKHIYKFAVLYAGFAFIISIIREVVKDIEDMEGDAKFRCNTLPIVWGIPAAKVFVAVWIFVLIGVISILMLYLAFSGWWISALYCLLLLAIPLLHTLKVFYRSQVAADYHLVSTRLKYIMLAGILTMFFIKFYQ